MKTLSKFIADKTPKFNKFMLEGICYHRIENALEYIDNFIKYSCNSKTKTNIKYLGYRQLTPKEEIKFLFNKSGRVIYDIAENDIFLVEYLFQYGDEEEIRKHYFYLPYLRKGNIIYLSGNKFLVMPMLADKVISIGDKIIFINILTAKYSFSRSFYPVKINGKYKSVSLITTELYKNQSKKLEDTTKANITVMHYLLANYGYSKTMEMLLGFVPTPVYDCNDASKIVIEPNGLPPKGYIRDKDMYMPSRIKFVIDSDKYTEEVLYYIGNLFYIIDNFPDAISVEELNSTTIWKRFLSEIIHSGNYTLAYLNEKINAHFIDLNSPFDSITLNKLRDIGVEATTLMELLMVIFKNFNKWIMDADPRTLYNNKTYEVESFVLSMLTSRITRIFLDINKEELRTENGILDPKIVTKIFKKYFNTRAIFALRKEKMFIASIEYSGDHLYPKNTAMVVQQESDYINVNRGDGNNSESRKKIVASMATVGSILGLSKKNPTPIIRLNPYVNVDYQTGTILPNEKYNDIINETDSLLANIVTADIDEIDDHASDILDSIEDVDISDFDEFDLPDSIDLD